MSAHPCLTRDPSSSALSLTLVTGPANSGRAGVVLGGFRDRLADEPLLVVPAFRDVEHDAARGGREGRGARRPRRPLRVAVRRDRARAARTTANRGRRASLQRELIVGEAVRAARSRRSPSPPQRPGFARAATRLVAELERALIDPAAADPRARRWAGDGPRAATPSELAASTALSRPARRAGLCHRGAVPPGARSTRCASDPDRWGRTPVFLYGFDDFTELELDAIESLAQPRRAPTSWCRCRTSAGRAGVQVAGLHVPGLRSLAGRHTSSSRPASTITTRRRSRAALHGLERKLFEPRGRSRSTPDAAVGCSRPAGERAEVELVAAEVLELLRAGTEPGDIAVVFRDPNAYGSLVEQVFDAYGIPFSIDRSRAARAHPARPRRCSRSCAARRRRGQRGRPAHLAPHARASWSSPSWPTGSRPSCAGGRASPRGAPARSGRQRRWPLDELDRLRDAADAGRSCSTCSPRSSSACSPRPYRRRAHVFEGAERDDVRAFERPAATRSAASASWPRRGRVPALTTARLHDALAACPCTWASARSPTAFRSTKPEELRARRFEAVYRRAACRRASSRAGATARPVPLRRRPPPDRRPRRGLRLPVRDDQLERERYLFYVCCSRAERLLVLSSRVSRRGGQPAGRRRSSSRTCATCSASSPQPRTARWRDVTWPLEQAPTLVEWERAAALAGPARGRPPSRRSSPTRRCSPSWRDQRGFSAGALEAFADCPVKWLVEQAARPEALEPDPEHMVRGYYAHAVLELTYRDLHEQTGSRARHARRTSSRPSASSSTRCASAAAEFQHLAEGDARARRGAAPRVRPAPLPPPRGRSRTAASSPPSSSCSFGVARRRRRCPALRWRA